ncbi:type II secretion system protein GspM [Solilutibacter silvestris]|uniref:type II secretion system protein GspM n=1 Tax=Solilutibacter silvestris TaxID=1645665 RepID=UPI003D32D1A2
MNAFPNDWLTPAQRRQRIVASVLAVIVVLLVIALVYACWWRPWSLQHARLSQLLERRDRVETVLHSRQGLDAALQAADQAASREPLLLPEPTRDQAIAGMMQRLQDAMNTIGGDGKRCRIDSQTPIAPGESADAQRVAVNVRLHCGNSEWLRLSQAIESARPAMFVDMLNIAAPADLPMSGASPGQGALDINMTVYGFQRQSAPAAGAP